MENKTQSTQMIVFLFLVSGFFYTLSYKLQGSQIVQQGFNNSITKKFFHPYMQGLTFFIGESLCILLLYFTSSFKNKDYSSNIFIIPAASDLFSVMLQCSALAMISGSTYMMLKGASIVTNLIFSYWLIQFDIKSRHIIGCGLAVIGLAVVGLADIFLNTKKKTDNQENQKTVGYILMLISLIFNGFLYAYEQKLLKQYQISPIQMVAWQGVYGTIMSLILIIIVCFIPCPYTGSKCVYNSQGQSYIQLPSVYLSQIFSSFLLFCLVISGLIFNAFYNYYGVNITVTLDGLTRSLLNVCRTALIWIIGIIISINVSENSPYKIQSLKIDVNIVKLIGFSCIISGTLIHNKMLFNNFMNELDNKWFSSEKEMTQKLVANSLQNQKNYSNQIQLHHLKMSQTK